MQIKSIKNYILPVVWTIILWVHREDFFFWDTIQLASKHASFFYDNSFSRFFLPDEINSGHPPFFGILLAFWWMVFGKSLLASHVLNMIFIWGIIFQAHMLGKHLTNQNNAFLFPLILFCNPYFLGHSILVSPDNLLIFFFLGLINTKLTHKHVLFVFFALGLSMVSIRGIMVVAAFIVCDFAIKVLTSKKINFRFLIPYLPAMIGVLVFFSIHFLFKNWIGFHEASPWEESFNSVTLYGYIYNLGLIAWRLIDFGNVFILIPFVAILISHHFRFKDENLSYIFTLLISISIVFILPLAGFKFLNAHRYFLPIVLLISFIFLSIYVNDNRKLVLSFILIFLFSGNFWIYPKNISQGWDVTMAHTPYYELVRQMNDYIEAQKINAEEVGTAFPLRSESRFLYLDPNKPTYKMYDLQKDKYIIYSNIMNDIKEDDLNYLEQNFIVKKKMSKFRITIILYERSA